jgi:hypothetical protein
MRSDVKRQIEDFLRDREVAAFHSRSDRESLGAIQALAVWAG